MWNLAPWGLNSAVTEVTTPLIAMGMNPEGSDFGWERFMLRKLLFPLDPLENLKLGEEQEEVRGHLGGSVG